MGEDFEINFFYFLFEISFFVKIEKKKHNLNKSSSKAFLSKFYKLGNEVETC